MKIQELVIEGFQVFRDETSIDFSELGFFSIQGENGSGKSTIIDAIAWVLFGKTRANSFKDSFINDESKVASISLVVSDTDDEFWLFDRKKKRGTGSQKIVASKYDEDTEDWVVQSDDRNNTAQEIIDEIVGMTVEAFFSFVVIDGATGSRFVSSNSDDRRSIMIQSIPEIADWDAYEKQARELRKTENQKKSAIQSKIENSRQTRQSVVDSMDELREEYGKDIGKARIASIAKEMKSVEREIKTLSAKAPNTDELDNLRERLDHLVEIRKIKVKDQVAELKSLDSEIDSRHEEIDRLNSVFDEIDKIDEEIETLQTELTALNKVGDSTKDIEVDRQRLQEAKEKVSRNKESISAHEASDEELNDRIELLGDPDDGAGECWVCKSELSHSQHVRVVKDCNAEIKSNSKKIATLGKRNETLLDTIDEISVKIKDAENEGRETARRVQSIERSLGSVERERSTLAKSLSTKLDGETFDIDFDEDALNETIAKIEKEIEVLQKDHARHKKEAKKYNVSTSEEDGLSALIENKNEEYEADEVGGKVSDLRDGLSDLEDERAGIIEDQGRHSAYNDNLTEIESRIKEMTTELEEVSARVENFEFLVEAMSPSGIPSMLIGSVLTEIEDSMNEALDKMPGRENMRVEFRQTRERANKSVQSVLDIAVHTNSGAVRYAETFSSGQLVRLSVAAQYAFVKFLNARRAGTLNTILLDEPLGNLDYHTVPLFIELLMFMQADGTVESAGVIAHDQRVQDALPQSLTLTVEDETAVVSVL